VVRYRRHGIGYREDVSERAQHMIMSESTERPSLCLNCGFEAMPGDDQWESVESPPLGVLTQCPDCGSTDVTNRW
jgi:predicted Zn-ribbon and HTH transcriptional regulator